MKNSLQNFVSGLLVSILLVSGCAKRETGSEKIVLRVVTYAAPQFNKIRTNIYENFEKEHPGVKIAYEPIAGNYYPVLLTQIAGNTAPDIIFFEDTTLPGFAKREVLLNLDPYIERDRGFDAKIFYPVSLKACMYNGKIYGLPGGVHPYVLYYNKDLFDIEKIGYPDENWSLDEFLEAAIKLTKKDSKGKIQQYGVVVPPLDILIKQNSGAIFSEDGSKCIINRPEVVLAMEFFMDFINKYHVAPNYTESKYEKGSTPFIMKRAAMLFSGWWETVNLKEMETFKWGIAPVPKGRLRATQIHVQVWAISKQCKHPNEAWEFLKYITIGEGAKGVVDMGDGAPGIKTLTDYFLNKSPHQWDNQICIDGIEYGFTSMLVHPHVPWDYIKEIYDREIEEELLLGQQTVKETLEDIEKQINRAIGKYEK